MNNKQPPDSNKQFFLRYASLGSQLLAAIGLGVFLGLKADQWLHTSPVLACVLPLLVLSGIFIKIFRETSRKKNNE
ncbi:MAG TPA: AtpZ/AtpI family protein [Chitinophagaceae bacterium]|nr:AtpZ/AtpI family protein [Chitinophagaceae bacterium]HRF19445.1 AtpZ/AtpI family protein [Chitinophagaceae bacterium]